MEAGTVTAKLVLETSEFNTSLDSAIKKVQEFVSAFNKTTFGKLEQEISTLKENFKTIESEMKNVIKTAKEIESNSNSYNNARKKVDEYTDSVKKNVNAQKELENTVKRSSESIKNSVQSNLNNVVSSTNEVVNNFKRVKQSLNTGFSLNKGQGVQVWVNELTTEMARARTTIETEMTRIKQSINTGFSLNKGQGVQSWVNQLSNELSVVRTKLSSELVSLAPSIMNAFDFSKNSGWRTLTKPLEMINTTQISAGLRLLEEEMLRCGETAKTTATTINEIKTASEFNVNGISRYNANFTELVSLAERAYPAIERLHTLMNTSTMNNSYGSSMVGQWNQSELAINQCVNSLERMEFVLNTLNNSILTTTNSQRVLSTAIEQGILNDDMALNELIASFEKLQNISKGFTINPTNLVGEIESTSERVNELSNFINSTSDNIKSSFESVNWTINSTTKSIQNFMNVFYEQGGFSPQITAGLRLLEEEMMRCEETARATATTIQEIKTASEFNTNGITRYNANFTELESILTRVYPQIERLHTLMNRGSTSYGFETNISQLTQSEQLINANISSLERMETVLSSLRNSILSTSEAERVLDNIIQQGIMNDTEAVNNLIASFERLKSISNGFTINPTSLVSGIESTISKVNELNTVITSTSDKIKSSFESMNLTTNTTTESITRTTAALERYNTVANVTNGTTRQLGTTGTTAGTGMNTLTNHLNSSRTAVNGLASSLLRVSSLLKMFGSLYVFDTVMMMGKAVTETITYKSEMDSLVKQLGWSTNQVNYFNNALDNTIKTYQKMNKYNMGETLASLGQEFGLGVKELEQAAPVLAMVQSEYVRAGRSTDEATLAVKDVLQGEFVRLSRETGVGKGELVAAGWSGDNKDVRSLLTALKNIGESRHWDMFATKATSLKDVMTILQNRFSEFAGGLISQVTPLFLLFFNGAINLFEKFGSAIDWLNNKLGGGLGFAGWAGAIGVATTALIMYRTEANLAQIAQMGLTKTITATILGYNAEAAAGLSNTEMIAAKILGLSEETVAYGSLSTAMANQNIIESISRDLAAKTTLARDLEAAGLSATTAETLANTISTEANNLAKGKNVVIDENHAAVKALVAEGYSVENAVIAVNNAVLQQNAAANLSSYQAILMRITGLDATTIREKNLIQIIAQAIVKKLFATEVNLGLAASIAIVTAATAALVVAIAAVAVAIGSWYSGFQKAADTMNTFNGLVDNGDALINEQKQALSELTQGTKEYAQAQEELNNITQAVETARSSKNAALKQQTRIWQAANADIKDIMKQNGFNTEEVESVTSEQLRAAKEGAENWRQAAAYSMKYATYLKTDVEKNAKTSSAEELDNLSKIWGEIDRAKTKQLTSSDTWDRIFGGLEVQLGYLKRDFWYLAQTPEWKAFVKGIQDGINTLMPLFKGLVNAIKTVAWGAFQVLSALTSTSVGRFSMLTLAITLVIAKIYNLAKTSSKIISLGESFKKLGSGIKSAITTIYDYIKAWRAKEQAETTTTIETTAKTKKPKQIPQTTGTTVPDVDEDTTKVFSKAEWINNMKNDAANIARGALAGALIIAAAIALITEAIVLIQVPLMALGALGDRYNSDRSNIDKGIEALQNTGLVLGLLLVPITALMIVMDRFKVTAAQVIQSFIGSAVAIAASLTLVAESVLMMTLPLVGLGALGAVSGLLGDNVEKGIDGIHAVMDALNTMAPLMPILVIAAVAGAAAFMGGAVTLGIAAAVLAGAAVGIAAAMGLISESIILMAAPLASIALLGSLNIDMDAVKRGGDAIRSVAEALTYVKDAVGSIASIAWAETSTWFASGFQDMKTFVENMTNEEGLMNTLNTFAIFLNEHPVTQITEENVNALSTVANTMGTVKDSVENIKKVFETLPDSPNNQQFSVSQNQMTGNQNNNQNGVTLDTWLEKMKDTIIKIADWTRDIKDIAFEDISGVASGLNNTASIISTIKSALDNVKSSLGIMGDIQSDAAGNDWGWAGQAIDQVFGNMGTNKTDGTSPIRHGLQQIVNGLKDLQWFTTQVSGMNFGGDNNSGGVNAVTTAVSTLTTAFNTCVTAISNAVEPVKNAGKDLGRAVVDGIREGATGDTQVGKDIGGHVTEGLKEGLKLKDEVMAECGRAVGYMERGDIQQKFYDAGYKLGSKAAEGYKAGGGIASPGIIARSTFQEIAYVLEAYDNAEKKIYTVASNMGQSAAKGYTDNQPSLQANIDVTQTPTPNEVIDQPVLNPNANQQAINQYGQDQATLQTINDQTMLQTQQTFNGMSTTVGNEFINMGGVITTTFDTLKTNTHTNYQTLNNTTSTQMQNMQNTTTKHIQEITNSWNQMETSLINSASNIRTQTNAHISNLESNMARFWNKVQNPGLLIASAGPIIYNGKHHSPRSINTRRSVGKTITSGVAGSPNMGINNRYRSTHKNDPCLDYLGDFLKNNHGVAGGWEYDWTPEIKNSMNDWRTHFGPIYDAKLRVGKFYNDDFPVRRDTDIFKNYVLDAIGRTSYEFYWDSKYGTALNAWNAGHFNCYDGALVVMALAKAFGLGASMVRTTWDGIGHMVANVEGVGIVDATAIQHGYGLSAPSKYAGPLPVRRFGGDSIHNKSEKNGENKVVHIHVNMQESTFYGEDDLDTRIEDNVINTIDNLMSNY